MSLFIMAIKENKENKILMQYFHYNYVKNEYGDKAEMLLTDNNSLMYKIEAENVYEDFYKDKELFDFSDYSKRFKILQ